MKLEVRDVACGYFENEPVLEHVSFDVSSGEICCILGPNGVGKTTLFKTILRILKRQNGEIRIDGEEIDSFSPQRMAGTMAYVAQMHVPPFPYKVKDVVMLGRVPSTGYFKQPSAEDYDAADSAMHDMGIEDLADRAYTDVSGGERQLVLIARALAQEPDILVLDEPTANLDYGNQIRVLEKISALRDRGYMIVMTTHSPDHAFLCDASVVLITKERQVICGPAAQVLTERNLYKAYGVRARIVQFQDETGETVRMCAPRFEKKTQKSEEEET
ncbi:MAG: ABC transporter ATP-binding protein [Anaerovoracaceae bacterium]